MNETPENVAHCPRCGAVLPANAPEGLCPRCVAGNLLAETEIKAEGAGAPTEKITPVPPPSIAEIAKLFPHLEILELLGQGGMGTVYKARQPRLDRLVALKILSAHRKTDPQFAERFEREARTLALLHHPNIVSIYDVGEAEGNFYLLMEFVDGLTLRQLLQTRKLSPEEALVIVPKICEALQYAHQQGIVHRDIKPENILMDKSGQVKIADFGIAKIVGQQAQLGLTEEQQVIGTPHYMAPEQVEHPKRVDHRADIYSLGVVLYEMLTGELPLGKFAAPSRKVHVDVRLDEVVLHALEKEPDRRYQQAQQVKTDMEQIAVGSSKPLVAAAQNELVQSDKVILPAFLLALFFGIFGAHRFYVGKIRSGCVQLGAVGWCILLILGCATDSFPGQPTLGILLGFSIVGIFIAQTIDWLLIVCGAFTDGQGRRMNRWVHPGTTNLNPNRSTPGQPPQNPPPYGPPPTSGTSGSGPGSAGGMPPAPAAVPCGTGKIVAPAIALMIGGVWKLMTAIVGIFFLAGATVPGLSNVPGINFDFPEQWSSVAIVGVIFFKIVPAVLILFGAYQMLQLRSYAWSMAAAIVSIIACSLLGLAAGIWAMIVLMQPDARAAFANASANPPNNSSGSKRAWAGAAVLAALLVGGTMFALATSFFGSPFSSNGLPTADDTNLVEMASELTGSNALEMDLDATTSSISAGATNSTAHLVYSGAAPNFKKSFAVTPGGKLTVKVDRGHIDVNGGASEAVEVHVTRKVTRANAATAAKVVREHRIALQQTGNDISVSASTPPSLKSHGFFGFFTRPNLEVQYEITVPTNYNVELKTSGGHVALAHLQGQMKVETLGGHVQFVDIDGKVDGKTMGGHVLATDCKDKLNLETSGGHIAIENFSGPSVTASTMGGHVAADFALSPASDCDLHTAGGMVTVSLPPSSKVTLDAETSGGSVNCDLPIETVGKHQSTRLQGKVNGGGPLLKLRTMGGNIEIKSRQSGSQSESD